jgi:hypothetical protein
MSTATLASTAVEIFSGRFKKDDQYTFTPTNYGWSVTAVLNGPGTRVLPNGSSYDDGQSINAMFSHDEIYAPACFADFLQSMWERLRSDSRNPITAQEAREQFTKMAEWIRTTTQSRPTRPLEGVL